MSANQFFYDLTPDKVLTTVESAGLDPTGRCQALGSYENRVYEIELDTPLTPLTLTKGAWLPSGSVMSKFCVAKFYRPGRWNKAQLEEEHRFLAELLEDEIPVVAPLKFPSGTTLEKVPGSEIYYSLFPRVGGRNPEELDDASYRRIGRLLGRIHAVGARSDAPSRLRLNPETYGIEPLKIVAGIADVPENYLSLVNQVIEITRPMFKNLKTHRLHGDCHFGNLLWNQAGPFFLDFDDMVVGPAIQDLWLLLPGRPSSDARARECLDILLSGYTELRDFDVTQISLIEPLRALRMIHYTGWIAKRWEDPSFKRVFPHFGSAKYWADETQALREQMGAIANPVINMEYTQGNE